MPTISLCMIVKNEEEVLARCLDSIRDLVDEIIIVDTGSTDATIDIARCYGATIDHFTWIDDFAAARNHSFARATSDYIIWLDADDVILPENLAALLELKPRLDKDIYYLLYDYGQDAHGKSLCTLFRERIIRRGLDIGWLYPVHECMSVKTTHTTEKVQITITHRRTETGAAADEQRNLRILEKAVEKEEYRDNARIWYYLGKEYVDTGNEKEAIDALRRFLDLPDGWSEDRFGAQLRIARCHHVLARKEPEAAADHFAKAWQEARKARALDPRWAEPYFLLGQIAFDEGVFREAIFWFEQALRPVPPVISPVDTYCYEVGPLVQLCFCYDRLGDYVRANDYNEQLLALLPNDTGLLGNRYYFQDRIAAKKRPEGSVKLNLGAGNKRYLDYISCDKYPGRDVDEVFSLDDIPYADDTVEAIHSEHALEHLYHTDARRALREWFRVLKPGGEIHLQLPDLEMCCRMFLSARSQQERDWFRYTIYGIQQSQGDEPMEGQIHYTGFTESELVAELEGIGFEVMHHRKYDGYGTPSIEVRARKPRNDKPVDIIIPTYSSAGYLKLCVESIAACTDHPHRVIVVNSGDPENVRDLPDGVIVIQSEERLNFSQALNIGIRAGDAPYLCFMNDDVIVSKGWLDPLVASVQGDIGFANPLSNCDKGWLHQYDLEIDGMPLLPGSNRLYEGTIQLKGVDAPGIAPERIHTASFPCNRVYRRNWVAFFCTVLSRRVVEMVGMLDEEFVNGSEDLDYCMRAERLGYASCVNERSFVFHFGGVSRSLREQEIPEQFRDENLANHQRIDLKYSRPTLVIHTGHSFEPWTSQSIATAGIGGSETAAARMAEELVALGYRTIVFSSCAGMEGTYNCVEYRDYASFPAFAATHHCDIFIASRYVNIFDTPIRTTKRYLWAHDIFALGTESGENDRVRKYYGWLDGIFCLSPWHADFFTRYHGIPTEKIILTGNGIDPERFDRQVTKQPNRFIYTSSPDRGLDTLLETFPLIKTVLPDAELHIFYGFDNWDKSIATSGDARAKETRDRIYSLMDQPGVIYHGRVGQEELALEFMKSDVWFYPTRFSETYCISALEAQMAGTLCVASDLSGLSSTVGDRGILIPGDPQSSVYMVEALRRLFTILDDTERKEEMISRAKAWAMEQTWRNRAQEWEEIFGMARVMV